jgi:hypothetical protein
MLFHVLPRFYGLVIAKKWAQKLAPSQSLLCCSSSAAAHYHTVVPNVKNPPKHNFAQGDFTSFSMEISANSHNFRFRVPEIHIQNLSNRCRHKYDPLISRIFQTLFLAGFYNLAQVCTTVVVIIIHAAFHR